MPVTVQETFPPGTIRNVCFICGSHQRTKRGVQERVVDLNKTIDYEGNVAICESCAVDIGQSVGMLSTAKSDSLKEQNRILTIEARDAQARAKAATEAASLLLKAGENLGDRKVQDKAALRTQEAIKGTEDTINLPSDYPDGRDLRLPPEKIDQPDALRGDTHTEGARAGMNAVDGGDPSITDDPKDSDYPDKRDLRLDPSEIEQPDGHTDEGAGSPLPAPGAGGDETDDPADADEPDLRDIRLDPSKIEQPDGHSDHGENQQTSKTEEKKELREAFKGTEGAKKAVAKKAAAKKADK